MALQHATGGQPVQQAVERDAVEIQPPGRERGQHLGVAERALGVAQKQPEHGARGQGAAQAGALQARLQLGGHRHRFFGGACGHGHAFIIATKLR
ncbi:hypothetical protein D9M69_603400 [compost metagenome]